MRSQTSDKIIDYKKKVGTRSYAMIMETLSIPVTNRGMLIWLHCSTLTYQLRNDK